MNAPSPSPRQAAMLASLRELGSVTVQALAGRFGVTLQTVRRDVTRLSEAGLLERFHGGVRLPKTSESNRQIISRESLGPVYDRFAAIARSAGLSVTPRPHKPHPSPS